jgi:hypothetical protein
MRDLQQNLNHLAAFRMILEGHSLKTAFARYHLTTPKVLREFKDDDGVSEHAADIQIDSLTRQLDLIDKFQTSDYAALDRAVLGNEAASNGGSNGAAAEAQPSTPAAEK